MQSKDQTTISVLMISAESDKAALLRQLMEQQGLCGEIRRVEPGRGAITVAGRNGPCSADAAPDVVMLDFSAPDKRTVAVLQQIARDRMHLPAPVILLTSPASEELLRSGNVKFDASRVFAPTSLPSFVRKMREHSRQRFLRALSVMANLGPILVRLPASLPEQVENKAALSA